MTGMVANNASHKDTSHNREREGQDAPDLNKITKCVVAGAEDHERRLVADRGDEGRARPHHEDDGELARVQTRDSDVAHDGPQQDYCSHFNAQLVSAHASKQIQIQINITMLCHLVPS